MDEADSAVSIHVRRGHVDLIYDQAPVIQGLFSVRLSQQTKADPTDSSWVYILLEADCLPFDQLSKFASQVQSYVDALVVGQEGGEDSSYDSDFEGEDHRDVSRTTSDTLGAEFAEYVSSNYAAKVEFALKLGYTEKQVQASLAKLGPNPGQNELLQELIKLGAQSPRGTELESCELPRDTQRGALRPIVIDGSNVAMSHGNKTVFSCRGIRIAVEWFRSRGHEDITVFVPKWRKEAARPDNLVTDQEVLTELERERVLVFTPSRLVGGKRTVCYDDRYVLRLAVDVDGIVVSNDSYRDLATESPEFKRVIEERTLMYSFVNDRFMPPDDPLGRSGPTLDNFLRMQPTKGEPPPPCPYGKKCTYGNKCKYHHPERGPSHKSVTERLVEQARAAKSLSVPLTDSGAVRKTPLTRTRSAALHDDKAVKTWNIEGARADSANLHRKLQRQLTLNPVYDPRLCAMRGQLASWEHAAVARIASAPDAARPCPFPYLPRGLASEPDLGPRLSIEDARRKIHYHLASIFPEKHVIAAMQSLPDETRPQEICAAILAMFPDG